MSERHQPNETESVEEEASGELSQAQLEQVAGGIIVVDGRSQEPQDPVRAATASFEDPLLGGPDTKLTSTSG